MRALAVCLLLAAACVGHQDYREVSDADPDGATVLIDALDAADAVDAFDALDAVDVDGGGCTITVTANGPGVVTSDLAGIDCPDTCRAPFACGTTVELIASPTHGGQLKTWNGACSGDTACTVVVDGPIVVGADFVFANVLTVTRAGNGAGTVTSSPAGISCGADCTETYDSPTAVTLTATPAGGSTFTGWSGGCTGTGTCTVNVSGGVAVTATFASSSPVLTVVPAGTGTGTVTSSPTGINCGADCNESYGAPTTVTLTAIAATGSTFTGWSGGGCSGTGTCAVTVSSGVTITATFTLVPIYLLTVARTGASAANGSVTSSPSGISCGATCTASYQAGTPITLTASAPSGTTFSGWSGGGCSGTGTCTVTLAAATTVQAAFDPPTTRVLRVDVVGNGAGTVTSSPAGLSCTAGTCMASYTLGTPVTLTATPSAGTTFSGWSGDCTGTAACTVTMSAARNVTAQFLLQTRPLNVTLAGIGAGTVTSSPAGINCTTGTCTATYTFGAQVTLTASTAAGSIFTGWSGGGCTGTGTCTVTLTAATTAVTATFTLQQYTLTVSRSGLGVVTSSPAGISCGTICGAPFNHGTSVTLTAQADMTTVFTGWSGGGCTGTGTCTVTLIAATTVTATFGPLTYVITAAKIGAGTITSSPAGINCGTTCSASYGVGTSLTLTATPAAGSVLTGWSGPCMGTTCTFTVGAAATATATFAVQPLTLTVTRSGNGGGSVTSSPAGINCPSDCTEPYASGTMVTLTASANASSTFTGWTSGGCSGTGTCTVTLSAAVTVNASFTLNPQLTVTRAGSGTGTVTSSPSGISCGGTCNHTYGVGTVVTLTATADADSIFDGWTSVPSVAGCTGATCTVTMSVARTVTATFTHLYTVTTHRDGGLGSLSVSPAPVTGPTTCATTCTMQFRAGVAPTFTAHPNGLYQLESWDVTPDDCFALDCMLSPLAADRDVHVSYCRIVDGC